MKSFALPKVSLNFQPINGMYGAQIKHGMMNFFEVDEDKDVAILKVQTEYIKVLCR